MIVFNFFWLSSCLIFWIKVGLSLPNVALILKHVPLWFQWYAIDIQTTLDHYSHVLKEMEERDEEIAINVYSS